MGQAQRVLIAMAVLHRPALLIADEPTSALDVITQSEILSLFARLNRELATAILYISHDLLSVASICHRIAILHAGRHRRVRQHGEHPGIAATPLHPKADRRPAAAARTLRRPQGEVYEDVAGYARRR